MKNLGLLFLRLVTGGLIAGHGSQKLFGWFGGYGLKGTAGWLNSLGLSPANWWASAAALSEFGGGVLTALGLFHPLGSIGTISAMTMATIKAHWGKPIWASEGGAELPVINIVTALALMFTGPGLLSLDKAFGIRLPRPLVLLFALGAAVALVIGAMSQPTSANQAGAPADESPAVAAFDV